MLLANLGRIDTISHILSTRFVGQPGLSGVKLILNALLQRRRWTGSGHGTGGLADLRGSWGSPRPERLREKPVRQHCRHQPLGPDVSTP